MSIQLTLPSDMEALILKRLDSGDFTNADDVVRRALEVLDAEVSWTETERQALNEKIDRAMTEVAAGQTHLPEDARRILATRKWVRADLR